MTNDALSPKSSFESALLIDDHPLFCDALAITLKTAIGIARIQTADALATALDRLAEESFDIVALDLNLPDVDGLDGLVRVLEASGGVPVVIVSSITEPRMISAAIRAGASGYVPKHSTREVFRRAFDSIAAGQPYVPENVSIDSGNPASAQEEAMRRLSQLTRQQARILDLICDGKLNKQIAYDLDIAEATVKAHITAIMRKLGVRSRTQAVLMAREVSFSSILNY